MWWRTGGGCGGEVMEGLMGKGGGCGGEGVEGVVDKRWGIEADTHVTQLWERNH